MFGSSVQESVESDENKPFIEMEDNNVRVRCGYDALHPMEPEHFIGWIKLYGFKNQKQVELGTTQFWPGYAEPAALFQVSGLRQYEKLVAVSYCNTHGIFESEIIVE